MLASMAENTKAKGCKEIQYLRRFLLTCQIHLALKDKRQIHF